MDDTTHSIQAWAGNLISGGAIVGSLIGHIPALAAIVALIWYLIQIYESATVQHWIADRRVRKLARLKARVVMLEAASRPALPMPKNFGDDSPGGL